MFEFLSTQLGSILIAVVVVGWLCVRQLQAKPVKEDRGLRGPIILGAIGLIQLAEFLNGRSINPLAILLILLSLLVGFGFGWVRGRLVKVYREDGVLYRKGNWLTVVIWVIGISFHLGLDTLAGHFDSAAKGLGATTLLIYIAASLAGQKNEVLRRAKRIEHER